MRPHSPVPTARCCVAAVFALLAAPGLTAQQHETHAHTGGGLGRVVFPVSCTPEAQRRFERAMAVLHSFWWEEGERAFGAVLAADSTCAMAWWGLALNAWGNPFAGGPTGQGSQTAPRPPSARRRCPSAPGGSAGSSPRRPRSTATPIRPRTPSAASRLRRHDGAPLPRPPRDVEVAIYHALALIATASRTDTTFARQRRSHRDSRPAVRAAPRPPRPRPLRHSRH